MTELREKLNENEQLPPLLEKIESLLKNSRVIFAIDGGSAGGKTTLSAFLAEKYGATVFHMDDFFLTPEMRTGARLAQVGGNVDRERFEREVLIPLSKGEKIIYRPYDCKSGKIKEATVITPAQLVIVEGAYSTHPDLIKYYDFTVLLEIDAEKQEERIKKRNTPELAKRFFGEWIPLESIYFEKTDVKNRCDFVIKV